MQKPLVQKRVKAVWPIYALGAFWLLFGLIFPLYRLGPLLICAIASIALYAVAAHFAPERVVLVAAEPEPLTPTGDALADAIIREGQGYLQRLHNANEAISDATLSAQIQQLEQISAQIFAEIRRAPQKAPQIRKFMNYFLPTTLKLLESYDTLARNRFAGDNISQATGEIEASMENIVRAFSKQLDNLYSGEALDISAETEVLEAVMAGEGLLNDPPSAPAKDAAPPAAR